MLKINNKWPGLFVLVFIFALYVTGCGQKGDLYHPEDKQAKVQPTNHS